MTWTSVFAPAGSFVSVGRSFVSWPACVRRRYCGIAQAAALKFEPGSARANEQLAYAKNLQIFESGVKLHGQWLARQNLEVGVEMFRSSWQSLMAPR